MRAKRVQRGRGVMSSLVNPDATNTLETIYFPEPFKRVPHVVVSSGGVGANSEGLIFTVQNVTERSFTIFAYNARAAGVAAAATIYNWIATDL